MSKLKKIFAILFITLINSTTTVAELKKCEWDNKDGIPCMTVKKTPNTSCLNKTKKLRKDYPPRTTKTQLLAVNFS